MALRPVGIAILLAILCTALLAGCCPSGPKVLESMTLPIAERPACSLIPAEQLEGDPAAPMARNPISTSKSGAMDAILSHVVGVDDVTSVGKPKSAYAAFYECEPGGPAVRVYAVLFRTPAGPERVAVLEANPAGVMYKGQLAGVVLADEEACESCYDAVKARAWMVLGK